MHKSLYVIREEHRALSAVLTAARRLLDDVRARGATPDFGVFRAMLHYIEAFPERFHHPKEDRYLFRRLEERDPGRKPLLDRLRAEHADCPPAVRALAQALARYEQGGPQALDEFIRALDEYIAFHWRHMATEENEVLPAAQQALSAADWAELDAAFGSNADPLVGRQAGAEFDALLRKIVEIVPAPYGMGAPWPRK
ncbi:MAG: hemerythrin domain-containing protein [Burkholderiales bacterium]